MIGGVFKVLTRQTEPLVPSNANWKKKKKRSADKGGLFSVASLGS